MSQVPKASPCRPGAVQDVLRNPCPCGQFVPLELLPSPRPAWSRGCPIFLGADHHPNDLQWERYIMAVLLVNWSSQAWDGDHNQSGISMIPKVSFSISKQTPSSMIELSVLLPACKGLVWELLFPFHAQGWTDPKCISDKSLRTCVFWRCETPQQCGCPVANLTLHYPQQDFSFYCFLGVFRAFPRWKCSHYKRNLSQEAAAGT